MAAMGTAAACSKVRFTGLAASRRSGTVTYSAKLPAGSNANTSSPGRNRVTSAPTASTVPAMSQPSTLYRGCRLPMPGISRAT